MRVMSEIFDLLWSEAVFFFYFRVHNFYVKLKMNENILNELDEEEEQLIAMAVALGSSKKESKQMLSMLKGIPTNQENWPNVFPYMALYWANVVAIVPTLGQFSWFVERGWIIIIIISISFI